MTAPRRRRASSLPPAAALAAAAVAAGAAAEDLPYPEAEAVFSGSATVAGETIDFPRDADAVEAVIVTLPPGAATAWHRHGTPLFVYLLAGEVEVTYEGLGVRAYAAGDAFLEAMANAHVARNRGDAPARILAVYLSGDGNALALPAEAPAE